MVPPTHGKPRSASIRYMGKPANRSQGGIVRAVWIRVAGYLHSEERGASLVEYALLIALIALAAFVAVVFFGSELSTEYSDISNTMP